MKDEDLINRLKTGKVQQGLAQLYRYFPKVRQFVKRNGGTSEQANDIFQESLLVLLEKTNQPDFILTASLDTYLFSICKYKWKAELIKLNRYVNFDYELVDLGDTSDEKRYHLAEQALSNVGERCLEILKSFYVLHLSMQEIASKMQLKTEEVAKNQKYRCLEKARQNYLKLTISTN